MTMPQEAAPRRYRRLGLYGPFIALAIAGAAWGAGWFWLKGDTERALDTAASTGAVSWASRRVSGFPFDLDIDFKSVVWRDPSGWSVGAPALQTEASVFSPGHWVAVAPAGAIITRPAGGVVTVAAKVLRASVSNLAAHPANFSLEGIDLTFTPGPGAAPFFLTSAGELHVHTRAGPADEGAFYVELDRAAPILPSPLGAVAGGKVVNLIADAIYTRAGALVGPSWAGSVRAWDLAGGQITVKRLRLAAGDAAFEAHGAGLAVDQDGRLEGALNASIAHAPQALATLSAAGMVAPDAARTATTAIGALGPGAPVSLHFQAGRTTLGPVAIAAAPKVY